MVCEGGGDAMEVLLLRGLAECVTLTDQGMGEARATGAWFLAGHGSPAGAGLREWVDAHSKTGFP